MEKFQWDADNPFIQGKHETRRANAAFRDYAQMGVGRSLRKLHKRYTNLPQTEAPPTRYWSTIAGWSFRYEWVARVSAWDDIKAAEDEEKWDDRRRDIREREWSQAETLLERVAQMLKFPLAQIDRVEQTDADGNPLAITIVKPVRWSQRDIARFMQVSSELGRLAAEMEQRRQAVDVTSGGEPLIVKVTGNIEPDDL